MRCIWIVFSFKSDQDCSILIKPLRKCGFCLSFQCSLVFHSSFGPLDLLLPHKSHKFGEFLFQPCLWLAETGAKFYSSVHFPPPIPRDLHNGFCVCASFYIQNVVFRTHGAWHGNYSVFWEPLLSTNPRKGRRMQALMCELGIYMPWCGMNIF